jgi:S-formylglutathione hydrolase
MVTRSIFCRWMLAALIPSLISGCSAPATPLPPGNIDIQVIPAPSLANNQFGEPAQQSIAVYLPPTYESSSQKYPVVYYLTGMVTQIGSSAGYPAIQAGMDALLAEGKTREMIVVTVSGMNTLGGSFYLNSPVTGNWEDFIVQEVVGYVDAHYRTLNAPASRGITGHSMGGFGALTLAMRHPDVFGAVYSMSPAVMAPDGLSKSMMFSTPEMINATLDVIEALSSMPEQQAKIAFRQQVLRSDPGVIMAFAYGAAIAPPGATRPPYIQYPYRREGGQLVRDEALWQQWNNGLGGFGEKIQQYKANLEKLKAIAIDYGKQDENVYIPEGCEYIAQQLTAAGIKNTLLTFDGTHTDHISQRIEENMLPFFSEQLR